MPGGVPPKVGWASTLPPESLNRKFPTPGKACKNCHFESPRWEQRRGLRAATRPRASTTARGARHGGLPPPRHARPHPLRALPSAAAHAGRPGQPMRTVPPRRRCPQQRARRAMRKLSRPARDGCPLASITPRPASRSGARTAPRAARDCHTIGRYVGTPTDCRACHQMETARVANPVHNDALSDCGNCHSEIGFSPARRYHPWFTLSGAHAVNRCSSCHLNGRYAGTPNQCVECHRSSYVDPSNQPNHVPVRGYSETCDESIDCGVAAGPAALNCRRGSSARGALTATRRPGRTEVTVEDVPHAQVGSIAVGRLAGVVEVGGASARDVLQGELRLAAADPGCNTAGRSSQRVGPRKLACSSRRQSG